MNKKSAILLIGGLAIVALAVAALLLFSTQKYILRVYGE